MKFYLIFLTSVFFSQNLLANLQVYPTRVFLNPRSKTSTISIKLKGEAPMSYRISTMFYEMLPDGSMKQRPDLAQSEESAKKYIRYSPKRIELKPGVEQVVRISARRFKKMPRKEVRTHLYFRPEEKQSVGTVKKPGNANESAFSLKAQVAVAVPVIVSSEPSEKPHTLENFRVEKIKDKIYFSVDLINNSERYLYGDFKIYHEGSDSKKALGEVKGVSSYIPKRLVQFPINQTGENKIPSGDYIVEFTEYSGSKREDGKVTRRKFSKK